MSFPQSSTTHQSDIQGGVTIALYHLQIGAIAFISLETEEISRKLPG
ncbi:hypothetical protein IQ215_02095 [Cyanobacterium stanieri LEGE 03274]|uniref:Uncharacterized protein n=1 Tax=Cyanobacterium stanieri LEGE 03274 TaxID=1828756 RepID=A0ABR9V0R8_9CHRO|nr:hypothetical protein [Cyanobacterium stanieri]MBE9221478.1 hypothetical protein [Cyanobacterium stanieri LEGE 03274]